MSKMSNFKFGKKEDYEMANKLPKLEVHFGDEVLHVPQNKKVNLIDFAYKKDTLKENILMCYRGRVADIRRAAGKDGYFGNITMEETEAQLIKDLKEFGDEYVFDIAWQGGDSRIVSDSQMSIYEWISDEEEVFEGKVEREDEDLEI